MFEKSIEKEDIKELPLYKHDGPIELITSPERAVEAIEEIAKEKYIGIDTETRPSFKKGVSYPVCLMQITTVDKTYLFRLLQTGLPDNFIPIMESNDIIKIGIAIYDDLIDLKKMKPFKPKKVVDLNEYVKQFHFKSIGAKKLAAIVLGIQISKRQQTSNWEAEPLSQAQIEYAATDSWICREIFLKFQEKLNERA